MKKIVALIMVLAMMLSCTALAEPTLLVDFGDENTLVYNREVTEASHVTAWEGEWVLVAAYISEDGIEEFEFEDVEPGYYAVPENAVTMTLTALLDASANDPATGPIVDQANYWHAHTHDLSGTITFPEEIDEDGFTVKNTWAEWKNTVRGEQDGDFNYGPAKCSIKGDDDFLYWNEMTGFDFEEIEDFKYIGINMNGQIVICSANKNIVTNEKAKIYFAYIFAPVVAEEAAE